VPLKDDGTYDSASIEFTGEDLSATKEEKEK